MVGGFAALIDVRKLLVYELAHDRNEWGEVIPPRVLSKPPTAELRPGQRDEDPLPPYQVLDPIMCAYVEEDLSIDDIVERGYDRITARQVIAMIEHTDRVSRGRAAGPRRCQTANGSGRT